MAESGRKVNLLLVVAICCFLILSQASIFLIRADLWFDPSFSLETVHKMRMEGISSIDFSQYDVHPSIFYYILYGWSFLNPGIEESYWARELSVVLGSVFLVFVYFGLREVFGKDGEYATIILAMSSSLIYYGTDIRMYMVVLVLSAFLFLAVAKRLEEWYRWGAYGSLLVLPSVHYFAGIATIFFLGMYVIYWTAKEKHFKRFHIGESLKLFVAGGIGCVCAFVLFALPQLSRMTSMWLPGSDVSQFPSALIHSLFYIQDSNQYVHVVGWMLLMKWIMIVMYFLMFVYIAYLFWKAYGLLWNAKNIVEWNEQKIMMMIMGISVIFPLAWLFMAFGGSIFSHLYHPRYFLVVLWMFAAMTCVLLVKWVRRGRLLVRGIVVVLLFMVMFGVYAVDAPHDVQLIERSTPCDKNVQMVIVHETPFTSLSFDVYGREHGCLWRNVVSTNLTRKMANSAGFDAIRSEDIYWNNSWPKGSVWYVHGNFNRIAPNESVIVYKGDGIQLERVVVG
jgi:hypothetical protein